MTHKKAAAAIWQADHPAFTKAHSTSTKNTALQILPGAQVQREKRQPTNREQKGQRRGGEPGREKSYALRWEGADYPRIEPGSYRAVCVGTQGPDYVREFHRQSLRLEFSLLEDGVLVSMFLNMGDGSTPPGARSKFFKYWTMANGERPRKGQVMTLEAFKDAGLIYTVRVEDCRANADGLPKADAMIYSRVIDILTVVRR